MHIPTELTPPAADPGASAFATELADQIARQTNNLGAGPSNLVFPPPLGDIGDGRILNG